MKKRSILTRAGAALLSTISLLLGMPSSPAVAQPAGTELTDIGVPHQLAGSRVASNPQDSWVLSLTNLQLLVITQDGRVFVHDAYRAIGSPYQLSGPKVAANPQDKWVFTHGDKILVITRDGRVFAHAIEGTQDGLFFTAKSIGSPYQLSGPKVAANPQDKWVLDMGNRLVVITQAGDVFAHDIHGDVIGSAYPLSGPKVAANPQDKWVLNLDNQILVITRDGAVFGHRVNGNNIGAAYRLTGPKVAANPQDKWVLYGNQILVITRDGRVFEHTMFQQPPPR